MLKTPQVQYCLIDKSEAMGSNLVEVQNVFFLGGGG